MEKTRLIEATCPDCRGPLSQTAEDDQAHEYRCLVGHRYSARGLLEAHSETQEKALWSAVVALEEATNMVRALAAEFPPEIGERLHRQAETKRAQAAEIRAVLTHLEAFQVV